MTSYLNWWVQLYLIKCIILLMFLITSSSLRLSFPSSLQILIHLDILTFINEANQVKQRLKQLPTSQIPIFDHSN